MLLAVAREALAQDFAVPPSQAREAGEAPTRSRLRGTVAVEDEVLLWKDRISLVPAVRVEVYRDDFPADPLLEPALRTGGTSVQVPVSPRFGVRGEVWPGVTLLGNVARYQRVPNLQELFGQGGVIVGNPDLLPETSRNWDLGMRLTMPARGPVSGAVFEYGHFDNHVDDLIVLLPVGVSSFKPFNIPTARLRGHEVALRAIFWRRLGVAANLTQQSTDITGGVHDGNQVPGLPALESSVRFDLGWSRERPLPRRQDRSGAVAGAGVLRDHGGGRQLSGQCEHRAGAEPRALQRRSGGRAAAAARARARRRGAQPDRQPDARPARLPAARPRGVRDRVVGIRRRRRRCSLDRGWRGALNPLPTQTDEGRGCKALAAPQL